jgi:hypothetical protein
VDEKITESLKRSEKAGEGEGKLDRLEEWTVAEDR